MQLQKSPAELLSVCGVFQNWLTSFLATPRIAFRTPKYPSPMAEEPHEPHPDDNSSIFLRLLIAAILILGIILLIKVLAG